MLIGSLLLATIFKRVSALSIAFISGMSRLAERMAY
jgi:hypothetical protein